MVGLEKLATFQSAMLSGQPDATRNMAYVWLLTLAFALRVGLVLIALSQCVPKAAMRAMVTNAFLLENVPVLEVPPAKGATSSHACMIALVMVCASIHPVAIVLVPLIANAFRVTGARTALTFIVPPTATATDRAVCPEIACAWTDGSVLLVKRKDVQMIVAAMVCA